MRVLFKAFDSKMASREKLFKAASEFASHIGPERLITLSHSEDRDNIVITIWYWGDEEVKWDGKAKIGQFQKPDSKPDSKPNIKLPDVDPAPVKPGAPPEPGAPATAPPGDGNPVT
jgi:hypothetical protein